MATVALAPAAYNFLGRRYGSGPTSTVVLVATLLSVAFGNQAHSGVATMRWINIR
jgi:hypothetical protein